MDKQIPKKKIAIIGCGPVGMFGALLLEHFGIDFIAIQKHQTVRAHPSAHWINASTKALFKQIPGLAEQLNKHQQTQEWEFYRYFRYVESLFGKQLGITDHFQPSIEQRLKLSQLYFGEKPSHIPQNLFLQIMYKFLKNKENIIFGQEVKNIQLVHDKIQKKDYYSLIGQNFKQIVKAQRIILCNGSSSTLKNYLKTITSLEMQQIQLNRLNFINIYFTSNILAQKIKEKKINAMLHFIYNKKVIGILVNHMVANSGVFVFQVVNYQPILNLLKVYQPEALIQMIFDQNKCEFAKEIINNVQVIDVGQWELSASLANKFYCKGIFLAGDCAHTIPPAGGFGMNIGLHDIYQLVHALLMVQQNPKANKQKIFNRYSENRYNIDKIYLEKSVKNYRITQNVASYLGYPINTMQIFPDKQSFMNRAVSTISGIIPQFNQKIRLKAFEMFYKKNANLQDYFQHKKNQSENQEKQLQLFFDELDINTQKPSFIKGTIMMNNQESEVEKKLNKGERTYNLYAKQWWITQQEIRQLYGEIELENIKFFNEKQLGYRYGERLISSNGSRILK